mmetsp:Transcript_91980/g.269029  ORF Transcript_91980/g.269029 Transcript_91980/m.269029 type:complete len:570 (-) Transcript_91980:471-2180(-)
MVHFTPQVAASLEHTSLQYKEGDTPITPVVQAAPASLFAEAPLEAPQYDALQGTRGSEDSDWAHPTSETEESDEDQCHFLVPHVKTQDFFDDTPRGLLAPSTVDPCDDMPRQKLDTDVASRRSLREVQPRVDFLPTLLQQQHFRGTEASKPVRAWDAAATPGPWSAGTAAEAAAAANAIAAAAAAAAEAAKLACRQSPAVEACTRPSSLVPQAEAVSHRPMFVEQALAAQEAPTLRPRRVEETSNEHGRRLTIRNTFLHIDEEDEGSGQTPTFHQRSGRRSKTGPAGAFVLGDINEDDEAYDSKPSTEEKQPCKIPLSQDQSDAVPVPVQATAMAACLSAPTSMCMPMLLLPGVVPPFSPGCDPSTIPFWAQVSAAQTVQLCAPTVPEASPQLDTKTAGAKTSSIRDSSRRRSTAERTTVVLQNLPLNYRRHMLLRMLDAEGFAGKYSFAYMPMDFKTRAGLGYSFIDLVHPSVVSRFWRVFDGYNKWIFPSAKVCQVSWSVPHQGLEAHIKRYRNSPLMHESVPDEYKPVLFAGGVRVPFPPPTRELAPPSERAPLKAPKSSKRRVVA